jgi:hypothetical protein
MTKPVSNRTVAKLPKQAVKQLRVFISYSNLDSAFVEQLARDLLATGLDVFIYKWSLKVGDSIVQKINDALKETDYFIPVLSSNSVNSTWVSAEINAALIKKLSGQDIEVLPILLQECVIPDLLRGIVYADVKKEGYKTVIAKLRNAMHQRVGGLEETDADTATFSPKSMLDNIDDFYKIVEQLTPGQWMRLCQRLTGKEPAELYLGGKEEQASRFWTEVGRESGIPRIRDWINKNRPGLLQVI